MSHRTAPRSGRRTLLRAAAAVPLALATRPARSAADGTPDAAAMLVAGPSGGHLDRWANALAAPLGRGLAQAMPLRWQTVGGADGVTGANQFEARVSPDGQTALLLPCDAAFAWLAGDPRARFDAARWVPVMSGTTAAMIAGRVPIEALGPGTKLRIAASGPAGPDLAALLALDLLGIEAVPVFNLQDPGAVAAAFGNHAVDAVFLHGEDASRRLAALPGAAPVVMVDPNDPDGQVRRDPRFPRVPGVLDILGARRQGTGGPLFEAWCVAAAAAQLEFALVLPQLAPASSVSLWRRAAAQVAGAPDALAAFSDDVRPVAAPVSPVVMADAQTLFELRRWLATRFNWQPA